MARKILGHKNTKYFLTLVVIAFVVTFSGFVISITEAAPLDPDKYTNDRTDSKLALDYTVVPPPAPELPPHVPAKVVHVVTAMQTAVQKPAVPAQVVIQTHPSQPETSVPSTPVLPEPVEVVDELPKPEEPKPENLPPVTQPTSQPAVPREAENTTKEDEDAEPDKKDDTNNQPSYFDEAARWYRWWENRNNRRNGS